jgi:hypothetical protein
MTTIPMCKLDDEGLKRQQARQRRLSESVEAVSRDDGRLVVRFVDGFDRAALDAMLAVERECCPFFVFDLDEPARTLRVGVDHPSRAPALDALDATLRPG